MGDGMNPERKNTISRASTLAIAVAMGALPGVALAQEGEAAPSQGLAEIIVTSSKQANSLQRESRAVNVVGAEDIERAAIKDPIGIQNLVPGLNVTPNGQQMQVFIRGIGDQTINAATDPAVAINVDGVYYPKSYEASAQFFDLERIEVLKGPQGTLYGRNASAGAINLITASPKFEFGGFAEVEYGNYDNIRGTAAINIPFGDTVALRVAGQIIDRDGFLSDGYNDAESQAIRAKLLIAPTEDTSLLLTASYAHTGGQGNASVLLRDISGDDPNAGLLPEDRWAGPTHPDSIAYIAASAGGFNTLHLVNDGWLFDNGYVDTDVYSLVVDFEHHFEGATLNVTPSYVGSTTKNFSASAINVPAFADTKSDQWGIETRLSSPAGSVHKWVVGAIAMREDVSDNFQSWITIPPGALLQATEAPSRDDETFGFFGEANISISDTFRVIAGARYTWEKKTIVGSTLSVVGPFGSLPAPFDGYPPVDIGGHVIGAPGSVDVSGELKDEAVNFRAGVEYDIAPDSMFFANVATGFKAGGFYNDVAGENSYKPEKLTAYSAGVKNRFFDNRVQLNFEAFYWDYTDKQETYLGQLSINPDSVLLITDNASSAELYGFEVASIFQISDNDTFYADLAYNHTKYGDYVVQPAVGPEINNTGQPLVRAPKWSGRVAYQRTQSLGDAGNLTLDASMRFTSSYYLNNSFVPQALHPSYEVFDASLRWEPTSEKFSITAYMKNIGDKVYYTGAIFTPGTPNGAAQIGDPRTYGVRLKVNF